MCGSRWGAGHPDPHRKLQVTVCFLRNSGTDHLREAIGPLRPNNFSREVRTASVNFVDDQKSCQDPTDGIFWIRACALMFYCVMHSFIVFLNAYNEGADKCFIFTSEIKNVISLFHLKI